MEFDFKMLNTLKKANEDNESATTVQLADLCSVTADIIAEPSNEMTEAKCTNYIPKVAEMLGVRIGERFKLQHIEGEQLSGMTLDGTYYFTDDNLIDEQGDSYLDLIADIITGNLLIAEFTWKPKEGDRVYVSLPNGLVDHFFFNPDGAWSLLTFHNGLLFRTESEAMRNEDSAKAFWDKIKKKLE